jgi:hypothetical protein
LYVGSFDEEPHRVTARDVGDIDDSAALGFVDRKFPCPVPHPMCGQVWAAQSETSYAEIMVVGVIRKQGGFFTPVYQNGISSNGQWPPPDMTLVDGPGSPWRASKE